MLIVFGGLPGTGKSTVARLVAAQIRGAWLRVDLIEQAMRDAGMPDPGPAGYMAAYALAEANLRLGLPVVADSVNPLPVTRDAWRRAAGSHPLLEVELICSDPSEHRRRVETRSTDIPGLVPPSWDAVWRRDYALWPARHLVIDTATMTAEEAAARISAEAGWPAHPPHAPPPPASAAGGGAPARRLGRGAGSAARPRSSG